MRESKHGFMLFSMAAFAVSLALPLVVKNEYLIHVAVIAFISAISALGLRLILATGQLSLGQAVFIAIGAYSSVYLVAKVGISFWFALPVAGVIAALFAIIVGWPALRLKGAYFSVLTFGLGEAARLILINYWKLSGGPSGIPGGETSIKAIPPPDPLRLPFIAPIRFDSKVHFYYLSLILLAISAFVLHRIHTSRTGAILASIEQSDSLASSVGINVTRYKLLAFTTACFFTGVSGAFLAHYLRSITPQDFNFWKSADIVLYAIIGGRATTFGPIIGALSMVIMSSSISFLEQYQSIAYGILAIIVLMVLPNGLASFPMVLLNRFRKTKGDTNAQLGSK